MAESAFTINRLSLDQTRGAVEQNGAISRGFSTISEGIKERGIVTVSYYEAMNL